VPTHKLTVTYQRGKSGKQEAHYDPDEIENLRKELAMPTVKEPKQDALATIPDASRQTHVDAPQFAAALVKWIEDQRQRDERPSTPTIAIENKPLLKLVEAQMLTGLSRDTLIEAINAGKLKARIIGRAWRIKREELDSYIKKL
jgi:excisionase family DNA binding protein